MDDRRTSRRLAAILAADVVGYSRMMAANEGGTLTAMRRHRDTVFNPAVAEHNGRVFKLVGDGTLVEFASAVDAVACALAIQQRSDAPPDGTPAIVLRIGINLGDIVADGDDIYGDGVNIAARLEPLADPGGICIAAVVNDNLGGRLEATFADAGEVSVKNIDRPIRVWKWRPDGSAAPAALPKATAAGEKPSASAEALTLPDKPSIAVLPFTNLSADPEQEYFADGITEDIITALSRIQWFFVIARNTTFTYKGQAADVHQIARDLGVRYVIEGSVRKAGARIRITAQLIDGATGSHLWAERYDRNLEDVFEIQDEITANIAGALEPQIVVAENDRSRRKNPQSLDAWDLVIQALARSGEFSKEGSKQAIELLDRAIAIDPTYARAYSQKAWTVAWRMHQGWDEIETALPVAIGAAEAAVRYDPDEPLAYIAWMFVAGTTGDVELMRSSAKKAIELNPNFALAHSFHGAAFALTGRGDLAFEPIERARRLSPRDIFRDEFELHTSMAYFQIADYRKAAEFAAKASMPRPEHVYPHLLLASSLGHLGERDPARTEVAKIERLAPGFTLTTADKVCVFIDPESKSRFVDGLRKAGVPA
jgi:TolB-like protein/class 3 adenylate cyclase/Flp pilus assembly protein TadD